MDLHQIKFKEFVNNGEEPFKYEKNVLCRHWNKVRQIIMGEETQPYEIEIQPTNLCNLHCSFCVGATHKPKDVVAIPIEKMIQLVNNIIEKNGIERIKFSGYYGEPLMNKKATLFGMRAAIDKGVKVGLFTNGVLIDDNVTEVLMRSEYANISLDAGSKESYMKIKGQNQFDTVIKNIISLDKERKKKKSGLEITIGYILSKENYKEIPKIIELLKDCVSMIRFKINIRNGMSKEELDEAYRLIEEAKKYENDHFKIIKIHSRLEADRMRKPTFAKCYFQYLMSCIGCDGKYYPCDHKTYYGGNKKDLVPNRDCELCPPMGFRINRFLEFIENEYKKDKTFITWIERYVKENLCRK